MNNNVSPNKNKNPLDFNLQSPISGIEEVDDEQAK